MKYFRIGDLAKICEVNIKTIRFYEKKELLFPAYVDKWTGYRYYDKDSIKRLLEVLMFKELGFSLNEIKNLNSKSIDEKVSSLKEQIKRAQVNINKLELMMKKDEKIMNEIFVNDEQVIGKWLKTSDDEFPFPEIYFLPEGKKYWVFKWTKGLIYICDTPHRYKIINDELLIYVKDLNGIEGIVAKYKRIDNKHYTKDEIKVVDDITYTFENDTNVIGSWKAIDFVDQVDLKQVKSKNDLFLKRMVFTTDQTVIFELSNGEISNREKWTKGRIIDDWHEKTSSLYYIIVDNNEKYLFYEWKSGDYIYGKRKPKYYVLIKEK